MKVSSKHATTPKAAIEVESFPRGAQPTKDELMAALRASEAPIAQFLEQCEAAGKVKNWKGPPASFLGYLIAHEAHHRGLAMVALRGACGSRSIRSTPVAIGTVPPAPLNRSLRTYNSVGSIM